MTCFGLPDAIFAIVHSNNHWLAPEVTERAALLTCMASTLMTAASCDISGGEGGPGVMTASTVPAGSSLNFGGGADFRFSTCAKSRAGQDRKKL